MGQNNSNITQIKPGDYYISLGVGNKVPSVRRVLTVKGDRIDYELIYSGSNLPIPPLPGHKYTAKLSQLHSAVFLRGDFKTGHLEVIAATRDVSSTQKQQKSRGTHSEKSRVGWDNDCG